MRDDNGIGGGTNNQLVRTTTSMLLVLLHFYITPGLEIKDSDDSN
jgi:hypothetical protein